MAASSAPFWQKKLSPWLLLAGLALGLLVFALLNAHFARMRPAQVDRAVLRNLRALATAADRFYAERGVSTCTFSDLVGPDRAIPQLYAVRGESYPTLYTRGLALTAAQIDGARTVTLAP